MKLLNNYLSKENFESYEDFRENFEITLPEKFDFARDIVDEWAHLEPEKQALLYCDDDGYSRSFTFLEISELSKKVAAYFLSLGIKKGDRVLTLLRRRWEYWVCSVALHRIGAVVVPMSVQLRSKDINYRAKLSSAKMLIAINDEFVLNQIKSLKDESPSVEKIVIVGGKVDDYHDFDNEYPKHDCFEGLSDCDNKCEFIAYFTSGTSGYPKMALHNRTYPLAHIVTAKFMQRVQDNGLHLTQADSGWAKFGWGNIYGQWICGSAVLAYDPIRFCSEHLLKALQKYKPTSLCIPPTMYRFLLRDGLERRHVESIKWFATAGEALAGEINNEFYRITGHRIHEGYGQSEGSPITCSFEWDNIKPSSMGKPSPLYNVAIVNENLERCIVGEQGEVVIFVKGESQLGLIDAYVTENCIQPASKDGIYHTGDLAYEDEDGYYWYVGRNDDVIKSSGYRIGPFEIESVLLEHPAVLEAAITGVPDEVRGYNIKATIVLSKGYEPSDELIKALQSHVKINTAPYKYPRIIEFANELPKTISGKIRRVEIRERDNSNASCFR